MKISVAFLALIAFIHYAFAVKFASYSTPNAGTLSKLNGAGGTAKRTLKLSVDKGQLTFGSLFQFKKLPNYNFAPSSISTRIIGAPAYSRVTIKFAPTTDVPVYLYLKNWVVGTYTFSKPVKVVASNKATAVNQTLTTIIVSKNTFSGIIEILNPVSTLSWKGSIFAGQKVQGGRVKFTFAWVQSKEQNTNPPATTSTPAPTSTTTSAPGPCAGANVGISAQSKINIVNEHNTARATLAVPPAINMKTIKWDDCAALTAYNYLITTACTPDTFTHNLNAKNDYWSLGGRNGATALNSATNPVYVGENWYSAKPDASTDNGCWGGAVKQWTNGEGFLATGSGVCTSYHCSEADWFYGRRNPNGTLCSPASFEDWGHFTQVMWADTEWVGCAYTPSCGTLCNYVIGGNGGLPSEGHPAPILVWQS
jgi:uncharacterized protein YkwD